MYNSWPFDGKLIFYIRILSVTMSTISDDTNVLLLMYVMSEIMHMK